MEYIFYCKVRNSLTCADVPSSNYSLTHLLIDALLLRQAATSALLIRKTGLALFPLLCSLVSEMIIVAANCAAIVWHTDDGRRSGGSRLGACPCGCRTESPGRTVTTRVDERLINGTRPGQRAMRRLVRRNSNLM